MIYQARIGLDAICFEGLGPAQLIPTSMIVKIGKGGSYQHHGMGQSSLTVLEL